MDPTNLKDFLLFMPALAAFVALAMQGFFIIKEKHGYRKDPRFKDHPEMRGVRKGDRLLYFNIVREGKYSDRKAPPSK